MAANGGDPPHVRFPSLRETQSHGILNMIEKQKLSAVWASVTDVLTRLEQMKALQHKQQALLASLHERMQQRRAELENSLGDLTSAERISVVSRAIGSFRRELLDQSDASRTAMLREAARQLEDIDPIATHYQSSAQMLMRESLGSSRRGILCQQIESSGPAELASLASFAAATKDLELAAALCSRNALIKTVQRSFSSSELADALLGEQFREVSAAIIEIRATALEVINADRAFLARRRGATGKIEAALIRDPDLSRSATGATGLGV